MRRVRSSVMAMVFALALPFGLPSTAFAQDWDVGPGTPVRPHRPTPRPHPPGVNRPSRPPTVRPPPPASPATPPPSVASNPNERRERLIAHLIETVLRSPEDASATLPALLRLVRERDGQIDALVTDFEGRARTAGSTDAAPHLVLAQVYREAGRLDDAIAELQWAERAAPNSPSAPRALGELYQRMDRVPQAREAIERALARTTDAHRQAEDLRALMELSLAANDVAAARGFHQRLVALDRTSVSTRRELAEALFGRRLFTEAATEYESLARSLAGDNRVLPPVLRDLGRAQLEGNDPIAALATFQRALALAGGDSGVRRELYDLMREVHERTGDLATWVTQLEHQPAASFEQAMMIAGIHDHLGHGDEAVRAYRRAISLRPGDVDAHVRLVQLLAQLSRVDELLEARRQLVRVAPRNPTYVIELASELTHHGRRDEALRLLAEASARAGGDSEVHARLAQAYVELGEQGLATRETELVARNDPSPDSLVALADQYLAGGQRDRALATARRMLDGVRDRARVRAQTRLAEWYADHDMLGEAIDTYREGLRAHDDNVDLHKGLAVLLERQRSYGDAVNEWRRVIELAARDRDLRREARSRIVNLWHVQGSLQTQVPYLERAFAATPPDLESGRDLAEAYARLRRPDEAERILRRIAEVEPGDTTTLAALERVLVQRGDLSGAIDVLRRLLAADPSHARDWYQRMAQHALALHRDADAIDSAAHAVQLNPDDAQGHLRLGELYQARNDTDHAVASFRRAIELNDRLFPTYFQLADLYLARGEARDAVTLFRRVIRLSPDDELVARAGRMAIQIAPAGDVVGDLERDLSGASVAAPSREVLRRLLVELYASICRPLISDVRHGNAASAAQSREALVRLGVRALKPLLDALGDGDPAQHNVSLEILGYLGNLNATSALLTVAEGDGSLELRQGALRAAAALGDPRALPRLVALTNSQDNTLATLATWGIAQLRTPAAVTALTHALLTSSYADARGMAALGLANSRTPGTRAALLRALDPAQDDAVRACVLWSLGTLHDPSLAPRLRASSAGSELVRAAALAALSASVRGDAVVPELASALFSPFGTLLPRTAARALIARTRPLGGTDPAARIFAMPSRAQTAARLLVAMLDPSDEPMDGAEALTRYAHEIAEAARAGLMLQESATVVLGAIDVPDGFRPLVVNPSAAQREDVRRARQAVLHEIAGALAAMVRHPSAAMRRQAIRALADAPEGDSRQALLDAARDPSTEIAEGAIRALGARPSEDAETASVLAARMTAQAPWTLRLACVEALAAVHTPNATEALRDALAHDSYAFVRAAAARGLRARMTEPGVREALEGATDEGIR